MKVLNLRTRSVSMGTRVDRQTKWGNPFIIGKDGTREDVIAKHKRWLNEQIKLGRLDPTELRGQDLLCWCAPAPCHADTLIELANN
jgi:hypothetical protein